MKILAKLVRAILAIILLLPIGCIASCLAIMITILEIIFDFIWSPFEKIANFINYIADKIKHVTD